MGFLIEYIWDRRNQRCLGGKVCVRGWVWLLVQMCTWWEIFLRCGLGLWREGTGNPLQYSCLENPMDRGAWESAVHGVAESQARLSDFTFTFHFHALEKEMATHSSALAWRTPGTGEPGGLLSMGSHRVGHDWRDLAAAVATGSWWLIHSGVWWLPIRLLHYPSNKIK